MTRETKIGLLVGLAFIILIGILLSDHLSMSAEPPRAALAQAGESVRDGLTVPGGAAVPQQGLETDSQIQPRQPVPTRQDLQAPTPEQTIVSVIPGGQTHQQAPLSIRYQRPAPQGDVAQPNTQYQIVTPDPVQDLPEVATSETPLPQPLPNRLPQAAFTVPDHNLPPALQRLTDSGELIPVDDRGTPRQTSTANARTPVAAREYTAQAGDSLSKIAARFYGRSTTETRAMLLRANPSLKDNPDLVISGRTYLIPRTSVSDAPVDAPAAVSTGQYIYTVKKGDSLWKIAAEQLDDPGALDTIKKLNRDVLRGGDVVRVGMKLRLPGRPMASAR